MFNLRAIFKTFLVIATILAALFFLIRCTKDNAPQPIKLYTEKAIIGDWVRKYVSIDSIEVDNSNHFVIRFRDNKIVTYENPYGTQIDTWRYYADSTTYGTIKLQGANILLRIDIINIFTVRWHYIQNNSRWFEAYERIN